MARTTTKKSSTGTIRNGTQTAKTPWPIQIQALVDSLANRVSGLEAATGTGAQSPAGERLDTAAGATPKGPRAATEEPELKPDKAPTCQDCGCERISYEYVEDSFGYEIKELGTLDSVRNLLADVLVNEVNRDSMPEPLPPMSDIAHLLFQVSVMIEARGGDQADVAGARDGD